ncbi:MAG: GNAT family N-acetyltransferase [Chloroflexota bacterium]
MEIRRVRPEEWKAHREIRLRALGTDPDAFGATLAEALTEDDAAWQRRADRPDGVAFVAVADEARFVGMANGGPAPDRPEFAAVYGMWVAPEARGQGIGGGLLDAVEGWARDAGYERIGLGVTTTNEPAIRLYASHGYADLGQQLPLRDGTDLVIQLMGKPL